MAAETRAQSSPANKRSLRDVDRSFKQVSRASPSYTIRAKTVFGDSNYMKVETEPSADLSDKFDSMLKKSPSWSIMSRGAGIPKPVGQPGPGEYPVPSTLYGSHPALPVTGRVPKTTSQRPDAASQARKDDYPSPNQYQTSCSDGGQHKFGRIDQPSAPKFSIRTKLSDPADRETRPGCQKYDLGRASRKGVMESPAWSMAPRGAGIPKPADFPGPGYYAVPGSIYGAHPAISQPGRVAKTTAKRFEYPEPDDRPF